MQRGTLRLLDEARIRDQLSAAEELAYVGHEEPAVVAAGAALEGALRLSCGGPVDRQLTSILGELEDAEVLDSSEVELATVLIDARDHLIHGWEPDARES